MPNHYQTRLFSHRNKLTVLKKIKKVSNNNQKLHKLLFQHPGFEDGNTPLHQLMSTITHHDELDKMIKAMGEESIIEMAKIYNDDSDLPTDILIKRFNKPKLMIDHEAKIIFGKLSELICKSEIKKIREPINLQEVFNEAPAYGSQRLINNLKIATYLANEARKTISISYTHPEFNQYRIQKKIATLKKIRKMRAQILRRFDESTAVERVARIAKKYRAGNCYEYAYFCLNLLKKIEPGLDAEIFTLNSGDHGFLVIDRNPTSSPDNPATWGESAVVCDAWSGEVYQGEDILHRLKDFDMIANPVTSLENINVAVSFNPFFQKLTSHHLEPASQPSEPYQNDRCRHVLNAR